MGQHRGGKPGPAACARVGKVAHGNVEIRLNLAYPDQTQATPKTVATRGCEHAVL